VNPPMFPDHRGKLVPLHPMRGIHTSVNTTTRYRMSRAWQFHPRYWLPLAVIGIFQGVNAFMNPQTGWMAWARGLALVFIALGTAYALVGPYIAQRRLMRHAASAADGFLRHNLCPACGYNLNGLPATDPLGDSCTLCPECGAAWRLASVSDPPSPPRGEVDSRQRSG